MDGRIARIDGITGVLCYTGPHYVLLADKRKGLQKRTLTMKQGKISFVAAVLMSVNVIVGVGIYFGPQIMAAKAGSLSFLGWGAAGLLFCPVIWCIALAARMFPGSGGIFNYCKNGINETTGFIATWAYLLGFLSTAATQSTVLGEVLYQQFGWSLVVQHPVLYNFLFVSTIAALNLFSVTLISKIQSFATVLKLLPLFLVIVVLPFYWDSSITYSMGDLSNLGFTIPMAVFGYWGFESCCSFSHLIEGGSTKAFSVILTAFVMSMSLYTLFHLGVIHIMGTNNLISEGVSAFPGFMGISIPFLLQGIKISLVGVLVLNYANAVYGVMLANIANLANVAEKKFIFASTFLTKQNSNGRPIFSILAASAVVFFYMTFLPSKEVMLAIANMGIMTALILTLVAVFLVQLRQRSSMLQLAPTGLGFVSCSILSYFSWQSIGSDNIARLLHTSPLLVGVILGLLMYKKQKGAAASS